MNSTSHRASSPPPDCPTTAHPQVFYCLLICEQKLLYKQKTVWQRMYNYSNTIIDNRQLQKCFLT